MWNQVSISILCCFLCESYAKQTQKSTCHNWIQNRQIMPNRLNPLDQLGKKNGTQWYTLPGTLPVDSEEVRALHPWHRRFATFTKMAPASPTSMVFLPKSRRMRPWTFLCLRPGSNLLLGHSAMHAELLKKSLLWKKTHHKNHLKNSQLSLFWNVYMYIYISYIRTNSPIRESWRPFSCCGDFASCLQCQHETDWSYVLFSLSCELQHPNISICEVASPLFQNLSICLGFLWPPETLQASFTRNKYLHLKPMKPPEKPLLSSMEKAHRATLPTLLGWRTSAPNDSYEASPFHLANQYPR